MIKNKCSSYGGIIKVFILSIFLFIFAATYNHLFVDIMSIASYLTWHNIFEFAGVLVSFSIFTVTVFTYEESKNLRMIILGSAFLAMGILDFLHTLSFKGMPDFFIANITANRATTLWIFSRFIGVLGLMVAMFTPSNIKCNIRRIVFVGSTVFIVIIIFILVTYYPDIFPEMFIENKGLTKEKIIMEYLVMLLLCITFIKVFVEFNKNKLKREYSFMLALVFSIFSEFAFVSYASVYDAYNYLGHIYKVISYMILYKAIYIENISAPYKEMKLARNELKNYSDNLNTIVEQRTQELLEANEVLMADIEYAKEMQLLMLPIQMPKDKNIIFKARYIPAEHLSGDFYNVIRLDENNIAIYIGDVSGHGVSAAMLTVFANQSTKPTIENEYNEEIISPGYVLKNLYREFNKTNFKVETYVVMLYGIYNTKNRTFTYSSAGINVPPIIIKNTGEIIEMDAKGFPICKLGDYYNPFFEDKTIELAQGDKILFYTDGLVETKNSNNNYEINLKEFLKLNYNLNSSELEQALIENLYKNIEDENKKTDDVTILIAEIK